MNTRAITIGIAVIILAGLAWYVGTNRGLGSENEAANATTTPQQQIDPKATEASAQLVGKWKSSDDGKYSREFRADGTVIDMYEGEPSANASGTWTTYTSHMEKPAGVSFPVDADKVYIQVTMDGELYNYSILKISNSTLELIYMDRGGGLRFTKVQ